MARFDEDQLISDVAKIIIGAAAGFTIFWLASHNKSPVHNKLPQKTIKNISLFPNIKIVGKDKHIHFHHWFNIATVYAYLYWKKRHLLGNKILNGFLVGSILQGLSYEDRFSFIYKPEGKLQKTS